MLLCGLALLAGGCHGRNNPASGYGVTWVTLTDQPADFTSYIVSVRSVTLTRSDAAVVTALATVESVDFAKLGNVAELWGTGTVPIGTYTAATVTLDYTNAVISVLANGVPQKVKVVDGAGAAVTSVSVKVNFDPANPLVITPTLSSSSAQRLAIDFNLAASTSAVNFATSPATLTVKPFLTAGISAPDGKLVRVRGPLINSSVNLGTYTVYVRPFHDQFTSLGLLTLFNDDKTVYSINGATYVGAAGLNALSQTSAGTTLTAAYTSYEPTATTATVSGAKFNTKYVIAGSTLEDVYTQGLEGTVIARSGNTLTLRGSTLSLNSGVFQYNVGDALVSVGPATIVTADNNGTLTGLNYNSIAVGQHIEVRGIYSLPSTNIVTLDATGAANTNRGSVRLLSTQLSGAFIASSAGNVLLNLQTIDNWPAGVFNFAGNGAGSAQDSVAVQYVVNGGSVALPAGTVAGNTLALAGLPRPFGSAPPDFNAAAISAEASTPASLRVAWTGSGTTAPFSALGNGGLNVDLSNLKFGSGEIRIGAKSIDLKALAATPLIVPKIIAAGPAGVPAASTTSFAVGNTASGISVFGVFATYVAQLTSTFAAGSATGKPALQLEARGSYDAASNTFTATSINVVL